ncbi:uncharacterized protein TRAVEDRAFT_94269, partial [Trametes versicolor FP-101664 SS1]|uniref:uncharacterized protein n=1 Tax=Trametes versicolor (strain FP-101664) TaxID=717944 RepID=UPI0004621CEC
PAWVRESFNHLEGRGYGPEFMRAVEWWTVLERTYGWETSTKGLGTDRRPSEVGHWLRVLRRNLAKPPQIKKESQYAMLWWEWWAGLQPAWRECDDRGIPVIGGSGDWNALRAPGKNGLLIVLLSLAWWREAATNATMQRWTAALADVAWV